jgi:transglutaminase-like putative cysteine protease
MAASFRREGYYLPRGMCTEKRAGAIICLALILAVTLGVLLRPSSGQSGSSAEGAAIEEPQLGIVGDGKVSIDISNLDRGLVRVKYNEPENPKKLKVIIEKGEVRYTYNLNSEGEFEPYPLQMGNGQYSLKVFSNVVENRYVNIYTTYFEVKLADDKAPFLNSTCFIKFDETSKSAKLAKELTRDAETDQEKVSLIYEYIVANVTYDYEKAKNVKPGYTPDCDATLESGKGICFDYSSLLAAMLRSVDVPSKVVMGYVAPDYAYHAWNELYIEGKGWVRIGTFYSVYKEGEGWIRMDATFAANSEDQARISEFVIEEGNYKKSLEY